MSASSLGAPGCSCNLFHQFRALSINGIVVGKQPLKILPHPSLGSDGRPDEGWFFRLKHMDKTAIHHLLEGLAQAACERDRPLVGRIRGILPRFWNRSHQSLPPRWREVPVVQMLLKSLRRICRQDSGRCLKN
ncbi:hypothetical protein PoB_002935300 [Plakobranchus ocellatus]|uniref:Uncharacterized protein n=1 Tax=Plakobranchus ocellatus TaxID=259542 RepID=A0AAV4A875_9GAST|nr:hypothetical protein PoB_002935300 [Plakobranchus ocellatus]